MSHEIKRHASIAAKRRSSGLDMGDLRNPLVQLIYITKLSRDWRPYLSHTEVSLVLLILDQTVGSQHESWGFSYRRLAEGDQFTPGMNFDQRHIKRLIAGLEDRGFITTRPNSRGVEITPNLDWRPGVNTQTLPKRRNKTTPKAVPISTLWVAPVENGQDGPQSGDIHIIPRPRSGDIHVTPWVSSMSPIREQAGIREQANQKREQAGCRQPLCAGDDTLPETISSPAPIRMRQRPTRPVKEPIPPVAPPPLTEVGKPATVTESDLFSDHIRQRAPAKGRGRGGVDPRTTVHPGAIETTMRHAFEASYANTPGARWFDWTDKERAMVNSAILKRWPAGDAEGCHAFFEWLVNEWPMIRSTLFGWMQRPPAPEFPEISFIVRHRVKIVPAFQRREFESWSARLTEPMDRLRAKLLREGVPEEALAHRLATEAAKEEMREENAKALAAAAAELHQAQAVREQAKRIERAKGYVHPESEVAKKQRYAEVMEALGPIDPNEEIDLVGAADRAAKDWQ
ncbi:hypothetical protein [Aquamicrobium soli]|uniref:Helix-turn-helix domain-containing protein n=1 Tax=Aquamicrobium soli TaxID=1811518 RepID=A0ABV7KH63_9HYPH